MISPLELPVTPEGSSDHFGYTVDDTLGLDWIDATGGTQVSFGNPDDDFAVDIEIGFDFKYYENTYDKLNISTNGLITFGSDTQAFTNQPIPLDLKPNNLLAPLWADLDTEGGAVYYRTFSGATAKICLKRSSENEIFSIASDFSSGILSIP